MEPVQPSAVPLPAAAPGEFSNGSGQCMGNDAGTFPVTAPGSYVSGYSSPTEFNCTANDVSVATTQVTAFKDPATGQWIPITPQTPAPQCVEGTSVTFKLSTTLKQNAASERQDIGFWVNTNGSTGLSGSCNHYNLPSGTAGTSNADGDQCAGLAQQASAALDLGEITVPCKSNPSTGLLQLGSCISWKVPGETGVCSDNADGSGASGEPTDFRAGTLPTNKAKCNCNPFDVNIVVVKKATIEVRKVCEPSNDNGTFDLKIDGTVRKDNAACGGTTGAVEVSAGTNVNPGATHTVAEDDFTTANYTSSYACTKTTGTAFSPAVAGAGTGPVSVNVDPGDAVVCTFTNVRKAKLNIVKQTNPDGDQTSFSFTPSGAGYTTPFNLKDGETNSSGALAAGTYSAVETVPTGWALTSRACVITGTQTAKSYTAVANGVQVSLGAGEDVTCTFTNTKDGSLTIIKDTKSPETDATDFAFTAGGTGVSGFALDDDADGTLSNTKTFSGLQPGERTIAESPIDAAWALTNIACTGAASSTVTVGAAGGFDAGDNAVKVNLAAGENVQCTFTNQRKARLVVEKVVVGGGAQSFDFSRAPGNVSFSLTNGGSTSSGYALLPGTYRVCELSLAVSWSATAKVDGAAATLINPDAPSEDLGNRCVDVALAYGDSKTVQWTNTPPPGGNARTIGYWKNWSSCTGGQQYAKAVQRNQVNKTLDGNLPVQIGDLNVATCQQGVYILDKRDLLGRKRASDAAYNMAAQLLAAKLNVKSGAGACQAATAAIDAGQKLLDDIGFVGTGSYLTSSNNPLYAAANSLAQTLDQYNNNKLCGAP